MSAQRSAIVLIAAGTLAAACVQVDPSPDFERVRSLVEASTGQPELFDPQAPALGEAAIDAILADGLSLEEALRLALLNSRDLQAELQEIGVAHADWVQARLWSNPSLDLLLRFPLDGGRSMIEAVLGMELLDLWRVPVRAEAARQHLEATVLRIARRAGECVADTRSAYHAAVAAEELHAVAGESLALVERSFQAVRDLHAAGAADAFDENLARGPVLAAQLALRTARIDMANARRELAKKLSLDRATSGLLLTGALPDPMPTRVEAETLVQQALASRLDLRAIEAAIVALDAYERFERRKAWGDIAVGATVERPAGSGDPLVGPWVGLTLPVFDQNQAQVARAGYKLMQMVKLHEAAKAAVAQDVRSGVDRVNTAADSLAFYRDEVLPQAEHALTLARESYAAGRTALFSLIEVQRQLLETRRGHVALRLEAALAASELERTVGVPLTVSRP